MDSEQSEHVAEYQINIGPIFLLISRFFNKFLPILKSKRDENKLKPQLKVVKLNLRNRILQK